MTGHVANASAHNFPRELDHGDLIAKRNVFALAYSLTLFLRDGRADLEKIKVHDADDEKE